MMALVDQKILKPLIKKYPLLNQRSALTLLAIQGALLVVLLSYLLIVLLMPKDNRDLFYIPMIAAFLLIMCIAILLHFRGKYMISVWITVISVITAPWISILLDPAVRQGDMVPILYVGLSVHGCAIMLKEKWVVWIAAAEMIGILMILLTRSNTYGVNWISLFAFILGTSAIAVSYGHTNRKQLEQIRDLSIRDSLTGLYNRRYMEETFDREIERAQRSGQKLSVIMTDVDRFKRINDTFGHVIGDLVLANVARIIVDNTRKSDIICRYGGDEFILILPECARQEARDRAEAIRKLAAQSELELEGKCVKEITLSFGISEMPENGQTRAELIEAADQALYQSKQSGRNRVS